eukprot:TRINITY_DN520_c0_g1_i1.p3 TRINITY_DN520_c0_g1~~TRINITY_DN520_c0_g1_i1.p3  ORF type:complete len:75 (+),score=2.20 TRINITY_DN520_c0_g1_i1:430-654(+)
MAHEIENNEANQMEAVLGIKMSENHNESSSREAICDHVQNGANARALIQKTCSMTVCSVEQEAGHIRGAEGDWI